MTKPPTPFADLVVVELGQRRRITDMGSGIVPLIAQMVAHEQTAAQDVPGTAMRFPGLPLAIDGERPRPGARPPALGEHDELFFGHQEN